MIISEKIWNTGLGEEDTATIYNILSKYASVKYVKIFGSRAKANYKAGSDIDLVIMNTDFNNSDIALIKSDFEESSLPYLIDLIDLIEYKAIKNLNLKDHINTVGLDFYSA